MCIVQEAPRLERLPRTFEDPSTGKIVISYQEGILPGVPRAWPYG